VTDTAPIAPIAGRKMNDAHSAIAWAKAIKPTPPITARNPIRPDVKTMLTIPNSEAMAPVQVRIERLSEACGCGDGAGDSGIDWNRCDHPADSPHPAAMKRNANMNRAITRET